VHRFDELQHRSSAALLTRDKACRMVLGEIQWNDCAS
jgi:hypothetical protein